MSMQYIRDTYSVPAKRGARVEYTGEASPTLGTITGSEGARLRICMDGDKHSGIYHPVWKIRYLPAAQKGQP